MKKDVYNLTNPQRSIWLTEQVYKGTTINNICTSGIIYENNIDEKILKKAINNVVKQHDSFRIHICFQDGQAKQFISEFEEFDIKIQYINTENELEKIEKQQAKFKFNILESDLFKFKIVVLKGKFACVILTANHIISDSWSMGITIQEILRNYHALKKNETTNFEFNSYIDYINSENDYKNSNKYEKDKQYWNEVFSTLPEQATIPSINPILDNNSINADRVSFDIDKSIFNKINNFCKESHISVFNFFMAVYSLYIGRVSNTQDFVIGTPILNRTSYKDKHTTGMFVNTVPVRINNLANTSFKALTNNLARQMREILRHQKYSYNSILEDLRTNNTNCPNLYNIIISYQITKAFDKNFGNYDTNWTFNNYTSNDIDIHIYDINDTGKLVISYDYLTSKYNIKEIQNMHSRLIYIINQVLNNADIITDEIQIVTDEEKNKILYELNNTTYNYPKDKTIIDLFENQAEKNPNNIAIVFENQKITYKELNEKANSMAHFLKTNGIKNEDVVAIILNRSVDLIIAIYAVIKSGATYTLIDTTFPKSRIDYIINDSNSQYFIVNNKTTILVKKNNVLNVDNFDYTKHDKTNLNNTTNNLCIIYTSGSTGKPKGVLLNKTGFINLMYAFDKDMEISKHKNILGIATVSFDMFAVELFSSTLFGNTLVLANETEQKSPIAISKLMKENNVQFFVTTPSRAELLLTEECDNPLKNVKAFQLGGEKFTSALYNKLIKHTNAKIFNGYGPTETTACCTNKLVTSSHITIGKPISNVQVYICDKNLNLLPIGVTGEICISGEGVSNGYLNNDIEMSKHFKKNPFGSNYIYTTGDLGKFNVDGEIEYIGRSDNQIKIRGLRIELEEIESQILKIPSIASCVVVKKDDSKRREYLCAYFTSTENINSKDIYNYLETLIPQYAIPQYFIQLNSLPYTHNGKIDRKKLPEPKKELKTNIQNPRNLIDKKLIILLKELLNIDFISIDDSFLELGGDSLTAINLCVKVQSEFNAELLVKDILEHPKIKDISDLISEKINTIDLPSIDIAPSAEYYPVSSAQKRIYFSSKTAGNNSILYNISGGIIIHGTVDILKLQKCFNILINRHEAFRTSFKVHNDTVVQHISKDVDFKLSTLNNANFKNLDSIFKKFNKPFNLEKAPLFDAKLVNFTNNKSALFINMHHIISDGTSLSILTDELCKLYNGESLPELKISYKDFANFENNLILNDSLKDAENYWVNKFNDEIPVLNLPTNSPRPAIQSFNGKKIYTSINKDMLGKLENISAQLNITAYTFLLACYYILLSNYTSQKDIIIGSPIVGRNILETYSLIGMFVNTLALRTQIDSNLSFKDFVLHLKDNLVDAYKYQTYPFDELVKKLNIQRDTSRNPLFDTMFVYQNNGYKTLHFNDNNCEYYLPDTNISKFDLSLEVVPTDNGINFTFEYATSLFNENFIKNLSNHYLNIVNCVLKNIDTKISEIDMISESEKNQILNNFNNTYADFPKDKTVIELFENQVAKTPNSIAIEDYNGNKLTYLEFNKKINKLARMLRNKGITRNDLVCIITNRSIEMMIGIWGIIKAGAAYVPIDPSYPDDRKNYILKDSNPKVVLIANTNIETKIPKIDLCKKDYEIEDDSNLNIINTPEDAIYCIYTSGTTGKPKGVVNKHVGLINRIMWMNSKYPIKEGDVILQKTTYCFDVSVWEIVWWGFVGAKVSLLKVNGEKNPQEILEAIKKNRITTMHFVPSMLNMMLVYIENRVDLKEKLKTLKYVFASGEELKKKQVEIFNKKIKSANPNVKLINVYGPTEASIDVTYYECQEKNKLIPIGKPISNIQMYILDGIKLCGIGIPGEICIGGVGVAKGYLNREELNKEKFIANPFAEGKLYRTGDIGRWLQDGNIEYLGRIDHQIKIRGQRIELDEIENSILKYPHIKNTVVIKQTIQNRDCISCYFVADKRININDLRKNLYNSLPTYMVPTYFIALDALPTNSNGKLDRKALPLPNEFLNISDEKYVAPQTKLQKELVTIWEKILNTKPIGINDNFFGLGGDSLLAMNLNIELLKISNNIAYSDIFRYPTIAELEEKINSTSNTLLFSKIEGLSDNYVDVLKNTKNKENIINWHPKSVLLTGATGFLGIHILAQFIENEAGNIYCIVRNEPGLNSITKLKQKLNYYFGNKYDDLLNKRIFVITGDTSKPNFGLNSDDLLTISGLVDVVINSAAIVSHFGDYSKFYNTNVKSVQYIIDFCNTFNIKLYHISTISVTGFDLDLSYLFFKKKYWWLKRNKNNDIIFDESCLYIGQIIENVYARSKFEAESYILDAISRGLDGYILRMGHLMPRNKDGIFQENILDNDLINKIISFIRIGTIPDYLLKYPLEFTPVDDAANAIYKLVTHYTYSNRIFHLYNKNSVSVKKLLIELKKYNYNIEVLSEKNFKDIVNSILKNDKKKSLLKNILDDFDSNLHLKYESNIKLKSKFTVKYLKRCNFKWSKTSNNYLTRLINLLKKVI